MSLYSDYYFTASVAVAELSLLEIEHPRFNPTIFRVQGDTTLQTLTGTTPLGDPKRGCIVTHEGGAGPFEYEYLPMKIEKLGSGTDMDQSIRVTLGDLGQILPAQLERVRLFNANNVKPIVRYRAYRSDDLTAPLTTVPAIMEIKRIAFNRTGCSFEAVAPYINVGRTGILYTVKRFPTMKAFFRNR